MAVILVNCSGALFLFLATPSAIYMSLLSSCLLCTHTMWEMSYWWKGCGTRYTMERPHIISLLARYLQSIALLGLRKILPYLLL